MENIHVTAFREALKSFNINPAKIDTLCMELGWMIQNNESPCMYWELMAHGAFKECYDIGENIIVKFAGEDNETKQEQGIIEAAKEAGLGGVFLSGIYIPLDDDKLPIKNLDDKYSQTYYHYTWSPGAGTYVRDEDSDPISPIKFNYIIIQEKIGCTAGEREDSDKDYDSYNFSRYEYTKGEDADDYLVDENGDKISYSVIDMANIFNKKWLRTFVEKYGSEMLYKLADFNESNWIGDLHENNIGYLPDGTPVILDWLS